MKSQSPAVARALWVRARSIFAFAVYSALLVPVHVHRVLHT